MMDVRPLSLVLGKDRDVIPSLLAVHANSSAPKILDVTHNKGVMWKRLNYNVTSMDSDPTFGTNRVGSFFDIPARDAEFDVVAFDPPHLPAAIASPGSSGIERAQYGLNADGDWRQGDNIAPCFVPFLVEARRVLVPGGIVIAKLSDFVHNHRYQWSHVDFVNAARAVDGMTPCDVVVKGDPCASNLKSSKWKRIKHFRRAHCFWIVVRKGRCEA